MIFLGGCSTHKFFLWKWSSSDCGGILSAFGNEAVRRMEASSLSLTHSPSFTQSIIAVNIAPWRLFSIELLCSIPVSLHPQVHPLLSFEFSLIIHFSLPFLQANESTPREPTTSFQNTKLETPTDDESQKLSSPEVCITFYFLLWDMTYPLWSFSIDVLQMKNVSENSDQSKGTAPDVSSLLWDWTLKVSYKSFGNEAGETRNQSLSLWHWIISHVSSISLIICM